MLPPTHLHHTVRPHESGLRLDTLVHRILPQLLKWQSSTPVDTPSRTVISTLIRERDIILNQAPSKPTTLVKANDSIDIFIPELQAPTLDPRPDIPVTLIFENEHFLIVDKPAGILTHPTPTNDSDSVAHWFVGRYPQLIHTSQPEFQLKPVNGDALRPGIVHRLDRGTSGLLILAKSQTAFEEFKHLFQQHKIHKTYLAIVSGHLAPAKGTVSTYLAKSKDGTHQSVITEKNETRGTARKAITHYRVLQSLEGTDLVEVKPKTGRTHQIRVHMNHLGHPIIGDPLYGTKVTKKEAKDYTRHLLHASQLDFTLFKEVYHFESPTPKEFLGAAK
ncbi:MAG: RluA family pseudouridine synthase [Candidatus Moraniibacteriota bacterium]